MHQQLWGYKVEWKSVSRGTGGKKIEYHCPRRLALSNGPVRVVPQTIEVSSFQRTRQGTFPRRVKLVLSNEPVRVDSPEGLSKLFPTGLSG
jgi:hypothetical protein